jgi:hypothetical protein
VEMSPSRHVVPPNARVFIITPMAAPAVDQQSLKDEIADLERRLRDAKAQLGDCCVASTVSSPANDAGMLSRASSSIYVLIASQHSMHCFFWPTRPCP